MECGVHLPLLAFRGQAFSLSRLVDYAQTAEQLGFTTLCADDHLTFSRPWLDSIAALASVLTNLAKYRRIVYRLIPTSHNITRCTSRLKNYQ
jgi:hypothetical protein